MDGPYTGNIPSPSGEGSLRAPSLHASFASHIYELEQNVPRHSFANGSTGGTGGTGTTGGAGALGCTGATGGGGI